MKIKRTNLSPWNSFSSFDDIQNKSEVKEEEEVKFRFLKNTIQDNK